MNNSFRPENQTQLAIVIVAAMALLVAVAMCFSDSRSLARQNSEINAGR